MGSLKQSHYKGRSCKKKKKEKKTTLRVMLYIFPSREKHTAVNVSANMQTVSGEKREEIFFSKIERNNCNLANSF